jgi:spore cortex formation protein SpoVR/YcgB (stage V sporulation)
MISRNLYFVERDLSNVIILKHICRVWDFDVVLHKIDTHILEILNKTLKELGN